MRNSKPQQQGQMLPRFLVRERVIRFLQRQASEVSEGGLRVLLRKCGSFLLMLLAVSVLLMVRTLRPVVVIRFGPLRSKRIGHFAANTELYLCERDARLHGRRTLDIFYHTSSVCNQQLKKMWDRRLHVSRFACLLDRLNRRLPGYEDHVIPMPSVRDIHGILARTEAHLSFSLEEEYLGRAALRELGIPDDVPFICFHARDSAYLDALSRTGNWRYHDYRDSTIHNYVPAVEELVRRGYFAIRMGAIVKEALNTTNPRIIDYATNHRTDFLDIYLGAKCQFFICDTAGILEIPRVFRRPIAYVNVVPLEYAVTSSLNSLFIPKKLWLLKERRFLTFREILESGAGRFLWSEQYKQLGVEVVENTLEEITALAIEMDERLKGTWQTTEEDEELQRCFWSLFKPSELNGVFLLRIGAELLRQNRELLD